MASSVRDKKAAASSKGTHAREREQDAVKNDFTEDTSSDEASDGTSSSGSDSDDDDDLDAARKKLDAKLASKKNGSEAKVNGTKPQTQREQKPVDPAVKPEPASESESESGSESESESETSPSTAAGNETAAKPNGAKNLPHANKSESESESESGSESGSEDSSSESEDNNAQAGAKVAAQNQVIAKTQGANRDESDSSESSEGEGESKSDSEEEGDKDVSGNSTAVARVNGNAEAGSSSQLSRPNWLNNADFTLRKASSDNPGKEVADFFNKTNLEGKQVWYFTAPASLPITVLKEMEIDLAKATAGGPILNHQGDSYGLDLEAHATNTQIQLLIPSKGGDKYNTLNRGIDSTVHLRRMAKFGPDGTISPTASEQYAPPSRAVREQPQGLKARFFPIGVPAPPPNKPTPVVNQPQKAAKQAVAQEDSESSTSDSESGSDGNSDEEMADVPASSVPISSIPSRMPTAPRADSKLKRKSPAKEAIPSEQSSKRHKSSKRASAAAMTEVAFTTASGNSKLKTTSSKPSKPASVKETPIVPPPFSRMASDASASSTSTPSKAAPASKSKDKKDKKDTATQSSATKVKQTPIPPPAVPGMRS
ncbi:hypothetical protein DL768_011351 [Monosporascus sp. mg162]|nr:hypothetical protein DL768_011351 [Monosporascus sp. mg162]